MRAKAIFHFLHRRAENVIALVLGALFLSFLIQIVFRYALNFPLGWTVEFVALAWLWGILFGYAFVLSETEVIRLDIVYAVFPVWLQRVLDVVTGLACAGILLWTLPKVWDYVTFMKIEKTAYMKLRFDLVFSIYIPFVVAVVIRSLMTVWRGVTGVRLASQTASDGAHDYD